jgi:hypothetical protein
LEGDRDVRITPKVHLAVLAIVALGAFLFATGVANAHGGGKQSLRLVATEVQSDFLDLGATGPTLGDELIISESLARHGRDVGTSGVVCTITHAMPPYDVVTFHCVATLSLRRGQITLQGLIEVQGEDDPGPFIVAITGGTGAYRGAGGEAVVRGTETWSIYTLRFDSQRKSHRKGRHDRH